MDDNKSRELRQAFAEYLANNQRIACVRGDAKQCPLAAFFQSEGYEEPFVAGGYVTSANCPTVILPKWAREFTFQVDQQRGDQSMTIYGFQARAVLEGIE